MVLVPLTLEGPGERLAHWPPADAVAVEPELRGEHVEPVEDLPLGVAELEGANNGRGGELALADERFRVDREPWLPLRREHVFGVQVLAEEELLALGRRQLGQRLDRGVKQASLERPPRRLPLVRQVREPPPRLVRERP